MRLFSGVCLALFAAFLAVPALAAPTYKAVTCHVIQVEHSRYGVLITCKETIDVIETGTGKLDAVNWFAPDASGFQNDHGIKPGLSVADTMRGFEEVALEAFRSGRPLQVRFAVGYAPGGLYDCLNDNCRLAESWAVTL